MLVGQSLLLGELVDYFTDVGQGQFLTECIGMQPSGTLSTTEAYMAALGEKVVSQAMLKHCPRDVDIALKVDYTAL